MKDTRHSGIAKHLTTLPIQKAIGGIRNGSLGGTVTSNPVPIFSTGQQANSKTASAAGHAGGLPVSDMLLPDVRSFGCGHADSL